MSRLRHKKEHEEHHEKHREDGGATETGGNPHVFALAKEKHAVGHIGGEKAKPRLDRKRGGKVEHRAQGGEAKGADTHPYSSAHKRGGKVHEEGGHKELHHGLHGAEKEHHKEHRAHGGRC